MAEVMGVMEVSQVTSGASSTSSVVAASVGEVEIDGRTFSPDRPLVVIPRPGEDPQELANSKTMLWKAGGATASKQFRVLNKFVYVY